MKLKRQKDKVKNNKKEKVDRRNKKNRLNVNLKNVKFKKQKMKKLVLFFVLAFIFIIPFLLTGSNTIVARIFDLDEQTYANELGNKENKEVVNIMKKEDTRREKNQSDKNENVTTKIVLEGDTLWDYAIDHLPQGKDPREFIIEIREYNDLENANLQPGKKIKIPNH